MLNQTIYNHAQSHSTILKPIHLFHPDTIYPQGNFQNSVYTEQQRNIRTGAKIRNKMELDKESQKFPYKIQKTNINKHSSLYTSPQFQKNNEKIGSTTIQTNYAQTTKYHGQQKSDLKSNTNNKMAKIRKINLIQKDYIAPEYINDNQSNKDDIKVKHPSNDPKRRLFLDESTRKKGISLSLERSIYKYVPANNKKEENVQNVSKIVKTNSDINNQTIKKKSAASAHSSPLRLHPKIRTTHRQNIGSHVKQTVQKHSSNRSTARKIKQDPESQLNIENVSDANDAWEQRVIFKSLQLLEEYRSTTNLHKQNAKKKNQSRTKPDSQSVEVTDNDNKAQINISQSQQEMCRLDKMNEHKKQCVRDRCIKQIISPKKSRLLNTQRM